MSVRISTTPYVVLLQKFAAEWWVAGECLWNIIQIHQEKMIASEMEYHLVLCFNYP